MPLSQRRISRHDLPALRIKINMKISEAFKLARECQKISLRELERKTGISNALLSQIETGHIKNPSYLKVKRIAKVLNVDLNKLDE